ncbi:MAG: transcription termination/antitermination protein NusA, partial [Muribaculaceae bacterium]|nr:transcription termination/antitermination protein NusA [Muribaculaceae bacterium]
MAKKKEEGLSMADQFKMFNDDKNIDKTTLISVLEESFRSVLAKMFGNDDNFSVIVNPDKGDCEIYQNLEVVPDGEVTNPNKQISLSDAQADDDPDCEVGEEHTCMIDFAKFGRRAILNLR